MPVDQKRINGPENAFSYRMFTKSHTKSYEDKLKECISTNQTRNDGRTLTEARKIFLKSGVVSKSKGSAYIEIGNTKVIVAVFDPREIPKQNKYSIHGELYCDFKFSPFSIKKARKPPQTDTEEKSLAHAMMRALQPAVCRHEFPNFQVDIFANVLQDGGSVLSAAITCAGLALADAGIPMFDIVTATTVGVIGNIVLLDPTEAEEELCNGTRGKEHGLIVLSRLSTHEQISEFYQTGNMSLETVQNASKMLIEATKDYNDLIRQLLVKKVTKLIKDAENTDEQEDKNLK